MIDTFINAVMIIGEMFIVTTVFWAMFILPFFYIWFLPTFAVSIWAFVKKKGWKIPLIAFGLNLAISWFGMMIFLMNSHW